MILAGDIGGTKTLLALFELRSGCWERVFIREFPSQSFERFEDVLIKLQEEAPHPISAACFGIAGPVVDQKSQLTNLSWTIDAEALTGLLNTPRIRLINDLEAIGYSLPWLSMDELVAIQEVPRRPGNAAIIAAGTGLGESILFWDGAVHYPSATEGGHSDFAPRNEWEIGLLRFLIKRYDGHVSYERILSGPGFIDLYDYVVSTGKMPLEEVHRAREKLSNPTPVISDAGLRRSCPVCTEVMDHFVSLYGAETGNVALKSMTLSGIYLGGGIAPRLRHRLLEGEFITAFHDKGRFRPLLETIPIHIILNPEAGLLGAARFAAEVGWPQSEPADGAGDVDSPRALPEG